MSSMWIAIPFVTRCWVHKIHRGNRRLCITETLRREIVGKDKQIQVYKDKLLDVYMGLDSNAKSESSVSPRILKATEEQNQLLRELVQRRDAEVDRLEAKLAQNEGGQDRPQFLTCITKKITYISYQ